MNGETDQVITETQDQISEWVAEELAKCRPRQARDRKVIRDAVHGFVLVEPYEVEILDCPLVQRLRYIHQTAFSYLVYPSANHTRFEHSLGVLYTADQMLKALEIARKELIPPNVKREVRLAGLLHDVSHTFLSHIGESLLKEKFRDLFKRIKRATYKGQRGFFKEAKEGEILSYLIITCGSFTEFISGLCRRYSDTKAEPYDMNKVAGLIIGRADAPTDRFLADIINGPLDADKLDYLLRDCYFSGIRVEVDVPRIVHTLDIVDRESSARTHRHLTVRGAALPYLEQILVAKVMLHSAIYHHHKVRSLECLIKGLFEIIGDNKDDIEDSRFRFEKLTDFLRVTEYEFFSCGLNERGLVPIIQRILNRDIPKRALVLCKPTVEDWPEALSALSSNIPDELVLRAYRRQIFDRLEDSHKGWGMELLWIDNPEGPRIQEEASHCYIDLGSGKPETLSTLFPSDDWLRSYVTNKLRAHVFYADDENARKQVARIAQELLATEFGINVKPEAWTLAHLSP